MKNKLSFTLLLLIAYMGINYSCSAQASQNTITVGSKLNDSTGIISISNIEIQQSIISVMPALPGKTISNIQPTISVGKNSSYLIFQVSNSSGDTYNLAVALSLSAGTLSFKTDENKIIYLCKASGNCTSCAFKKDNNQNIIGCE